MLDTSLSADPRLPDPAADRAGAQPRKVLSGITPSGSLTLGNYRVHSGGSLPISATLRHRSSWRTCMP